MKYVGELAALCTAFCWAGGTILFAYSGRRIGSYIVNKLRIVMAVALLSILLMIRYGNLFPSGLDLQALAYLALSGIVGLSIGDTFYFRCLVILGPRRGALYMTLAPVMTALIAFAILGETIAPLAWVGIFVTLAGVSWVTTDRRDDKLDHREGSKTVGILMGVGGAAGQALALVLAKKGMGETFDPMSATLIRMISAAIAIWIVAVVRGEMRATVGAIKDQKAMMALWGAALLGPTIGVWMSLTAVQHTEAGIAATIMSTFPIIVIPLTMIVHKERPTYRSILGAMIAIAGVAMLFVT